MKAVSDLKKDHRRMTILEIVGNSSKGGMENYITKFIEQLPRDQYRIVCICPFESRFTSDLRELGVEDVFVTPIEDDPEWRSIQLTVEVARLYKADVLHAHMPKAHVLAGLAGLILEKPVVATIHGMNITAFEQGVALAVKSHLITNCQDAFTQALAMGIPSERVSLVKNGVDLNLFKSTNPKKELRGKLGLGKGTPLVGFVARLEEEKGPDLFIRVAEHVHKSRPDIHFVIVGEGSMQKKLKESCKKLKLHNHVHFAGWMLDNYDIYNELDILAHTSRSDGTSLAVMEAMACCCPVVGFAIGGVRELIENEITGLVIEKGAWENLANKIIDLFEEPKRIELMRSQCVERVHKHFDVARNTKEVIEIIKEVAFGDSTNQKLLSQSINLAKIVNGTSMQKGSEKFPVT